MLANFRDIDNARMSDLSHLEPLWQLVTLRVSSIYYDGIGIGCFDFYSYTNPRNDFYLKFVFYALTVNFKLSLNKYNFDMVN